MKFEWDETKNEANIAKHGISFEDAMRIFSGLVVTRIDDRFDYGEDRLISLGRLDGVIIIAVAHTDRDRVIRLISARRANRQERKAYETAV